MAGREEEASEPGVDPRARCPLAREEPSPLSSLRYSKSDSILIGEAQGSTHQPPAARKEGEPTPIPASGQGFDHHLQVTESSRHTQTLDSH